MEANLGTLTCARSGCFLRYRKVIQETVELEKGIRYTVISD